jgi:DNA polymerase elongation subunit (family B)|tara:strand:- start:1071 stop:2279 length:1209 start_codon:yes stop_codon:yes gene_type:complete
MNVEELENKSIEELTDNEAKLLVDHYKQLSAKYTAYEQAVKLTLNSIYGAFGNKWFHFFNIDIAESITKQGKNAILYSETILNKYVNDFWHKDTAVHSHFGIKVKGKIEKPSVIYIDTDSCYVQFQDLYESIIWPEETEKMEIDVFILALYGFRLRDYITKCMQKYADKRNSDNYLMFELEALAYNGIWMSKKKYIQNIAWDDKLEITDRHTSLKKIKTIGFDTIQSSTPKFAREKLVEALKIIFKSRVTPTAEDLQSLVVFMKETKKQFKLADIDEISFNRRTNNIDKYIVDDQKEFQIGLKCPANVKAAGYYNYLLNNNKKYKNKYKVIGNGEKLKIYNCKSPISEVYAYMPGDHPYEIAPEIDYDTQFEKAMIDPLNRVLTAIGLQTLDTNLIYASSLF